MPSLTVAIAANGLQLAGPGTDGVQGLQTLTMANASGSQPGTTILQYAQTSDGQQILVPSNQVVVQSEYPLRTWLHPCHRECHLLMLPRLVSPSCLWRHADVPDPHHAHHLLPAPDRGDDVPRHSDVADEQDG